MRSLLIVATHDETALAAALASEADALALDIAPDGRAAATRLLASGQWPRASFVRVRPLASGETDGDLDAVLPYAPAAILLPQCSGGADVQRLGAKLALREAEHGLADGATRIIAMIDTAQALMAMASFRNASPRLVALAWDAEALRADLGAEALRDASGAYPGALRLARELTLAAAASARVAAIDTGAALDGEALRAQALAARRDGFAAGVARDPAQAAILNAVFAK